LNSLFFSFCLLLIASSVHTKAAGATWLLAALIGLLAWGRQRIYHNEQPNNTRDFKTGGVTRAARIWAIAALVALILKAIPMLYWGSSWDERHAEIRLLIGALGIYGLTHISLPARALGWLAVALGAASLLAATLIGLYGPNSPPTNRIPWASGVSVIVLAALGAAWLCDGWQRIALIATSLFGAMGILFLSQVRGAMPIAVVWLILQISVSLTTKANEGQRLGRKQFGALTIVVLTVAGAYLLTGTSAFYAAASKRIALAKEEAVAFAISEAGNQNTSVGARLHMWSEASPIIASNLTWGIGKEARLTHIRQWGQELKSPVIQSLGHVHNEYLQTLLEHGLWGLASFLSYAIGILLAAQALWRARIKIPALTLCSIAAMHSIVEITNVNFAHNYYPTLLSLSVSVTLMAGMLTHLSQDGRLKTT
jgi:O-antigen ligase